MSSPIALVTPNISRCRLSRVEKYERQDDLPLNMALFFLVGFGGAQLESLALVGEKGETSAVGVLLLVLRGFFGGFWVIPLSVVLF